jgi:hypothetical protein
MLLRTSIVAASRYPISVACPPAAPLLDLALLLCMDSMLPCWAHVLPAPGAALLCSTQLVLTLSVDCLLIFVNKPAFTCVSRRP